MKANLEPVQNNPARPAPAEVLARIVPVAVEYVGFDGRQHTGVMEVNRAAVRDVRGFFTRALHLQFPIEMVVRVSDVPYRWNDDALMAANASSGFNYRFVAGTRRISNHGLGLAMDINPRLNPYIHARQGKHMVVPEGAEWRPGVPGTLSAEHPLVQYMEKLGWTWGGRWDVAEHGATDYQHFEKPLEQMTENR